MILAEEEELAAGNWGTGDAASDPLRMLRESGYIGTLRIFDYGRWPPFSTGVGESLAQFFRFFYPANIGGGYAFAMQNVRVGPHWIMVSFRPVCSSSSVASHGDGDLLSRSPCTGHCDLREAGKGVPYIEITEENPVVRDVVVRLNAVYRNPDDTTGGGSKCN